MANYNKSFNFRNGVQVDNDNFVVNANGLVGIGTTIPEGYLLNVYGDTRVTGLVTAATINVVNLNVTGITTVGFLTAQNINTSGVVTATTFYGSATGLTNIYAIAVDGWHVTAGSISTISKVGIGTTLPTGNLQVGIAVTINNDGNATYTGIVTASSFAGIGSNITQINASNISLGTLNNARLPSNINLSGIITGYSFSGFGTDISGINASNISLGTLNNARLPSNISVTGTISGYSFSGFGTDISGINASNISLGTLNNARLPSNISVGTVTATTFTGNLTGTATTATSLSGNPNISVAIATASNSLNVGTDGTGFSALNTGRIGVGTAIPTSELQIIKNNDSLVEVISQTNQARISIGQSVGVGRSTAVIRFGNTNKTLDILNNDTGNINLYLHAGPSGIGTGRFDWIYGQTNAELMSLTYNGRLGIGITNPSSNLHVVGTSTVTGTAYFGASAEVLGSLTIGSGENKAILGSSSGILRNVNLNNTSGITTLSELHVSGVSSVGIGTTSPIVGLDARLQTGLFNRIGISTTNSNFNPQLFVNGTVGIVEKIGIGTTAPLAQINDPTNGILDSGSLQVFGQTNIYNSNIIIRGIGGIGINSAFPIGAIDLRFANLTASLRGAFYPPVLTTSERNALTPTYVAAGAIIYNSNTGRHQGYNGSTWNDFY